MKHNVRSLLDELGSEIRNSKALTEKDRKHLESIVYEIETVLRISGDAAIKSESSIERLKAATERFEVSHPQLTAVLGRVIDALSNMGI